MTDEGRRGDPMDLIELLNGMRNVATGSRAMFAALVEEGFSESEALALVRAWLHGSAGGKLQ